MIKINTFSKSTGIFLIFLVVISGCQTEKLVKFPTIIDISALSQEQNSFGYYAISPNGYEYYSTYGAKRSITGDSLVSLHYMDCTGKAPLLLSSDGRFLSGSTDFFGLGVFDLENALCLHPENPLSLNPIESWSPLSNRFILAQSKIIMDFPSFSVVPYTNGYPFDFSKAEDLYGDGRFLWDQGMNLPIAELVTECLGCLSDDDPSYPNLSAKWKLKIVPLRNPNQTEPISQNEDNLLVSEWLTYPIYPIFDSSGEYVIVGLKERNLIQTSTSPYDYSDPNNIKDTVVYLIHWRTKEKMEILRLSEYGSPHNYISSQISWSEDRSAILIPRYQAAPLVVRLKWE